METTCVVQIPCQVCQQADAVSETENTSSQERQGAWLVSLRSRVNDFSLFCVSGCPISLDSSKRREEGELGYIFLFLLKISRKRFIWSKFGQQRNGLILKE